MSKNVMAFFVLVTVMLILLFFYMVNINNNILPVKMFASHSLQLNKNIVIFRSWHSEVDTKEDKVETKKVIEIDKNGMKNGKDSEVYVRKDPTVKVNSESVSKRQLIVFIAISSHPRRLSRRTAIRKTWMTECKSDPRSQCNFFMDKLDRFGKPVQNASLNELRSESSKNDNDIIFLETFGGNNMGYRMAKIMQYVLANFDIDFFLRLDDDHFLCYDRLIRELPYRKQNDRQLYWGYYWQCRQVDSAHPDEAFLMLSAELVQAMVDDFDNLPCTAFGAMFVAEWVWREWDRFNILFYDDKRIAHVKGPTKKLIDKYVRDRQTDLCHRHISFHEAYGDEQLALYPLVVEGRKQLGTNYSVPKIVNKCLLPKTRKFKYNSYVRNRYGKRADSIPCGKKPIWNDEWGGTAGWKH